jgi:Glyoxalase-like domain
MRLTATVLGAPDAQELAAFYRRPAWPAGPGDQQMMSHLDIEADDLEAAGAHAVAAGAMLAGHQPQDHVRVYLDPAGHPAATSSRCSRTGRAARSTCAGACTRADPPKPRYHRTHGLPMTVT